MLRDGRSRCWRVHPAPNALKRALKKACPDATLDISKRWKFFVDVFKDKLTWCKGQLVRRDSVDDDGSEEYILNEDVNRTHEQASTYLRLSYAFCYYTAHGAHSP